MNIDEELLLNRILDRYGEALRRNMTPEVRERFDRLKPEQRRAIAQKKLMETANEY
jgi:hypothetical protein